MYGNMRAFVEAKMLVWARKRIGATIEVVSARTKIPADQIAKWESGAGFPSFAKLQKLADFYRLHTSAFFLSEPPKQRGTGKINLRRFHSIIKHDFSVDLNRFLVECVDKRELVREIYENAGGGRIDRTIVSFSEPGQAANFVRNKLEIKWDGRKKDSRMWFNEVRDRVESLGLLVFQSNRYADMSGLRGIAINEDEFPFMILNKSDSYNARSFTMVHELVHIMCDHDDVFLTGRSEMSPEQEALEVWANKVTSEALVPRRYYQDLQSRLVPLFSDPYELCREIASYFGVSAEVIARKLLDDKIIDAELYRAVRKEGENRVKLRQKDGRAIPHYTCLSENGRFFVRTILSKYADGSFSKLEASSFLGLKQNSFDKLLAYIG